jgi:type II secretory ATPase GspE/PulE/Tfp pilus assembly ATPase PilB-like protein
MAQRLLRKICPYCVSNITVDDEILISLGVDLEKAKKQYSYPIALKEGKGCTRCRGTGYLGRTGIFEVMNIDRNMRQLIAEHGEVNTEVIRKKALSNGMTTLRNDAIDKMLQGITTYQEVARITDM